MRKHDEWTNAGGSWVKKDLANPKVGIQIGWFTEWLIQLTSELKSELFGSSICLFEQISSIIWKNLETSFSDKQ